MATKRRQQIRQQNIDHIVLRLSEALEAGAIECGGNLSEQLDALLTAAERAAQFVLDASPTAREYNRMIIAQRILDRLFNPIVQRDEVIH